MTVTTTPQPTGITLHNASRVLDISFDDGASFSLPYEYLRVYSPSAEVQGHGKGQETLQLGKRLVGLSGLEPVGNYALQPTFSDGHNSGLYTWSYLYKLGAEKDALWQDYLDRLSAAGYPGDSGRDAKADMTIKQSSGGGSCGSGGCGHKH